MNALKEPPVLESTPAGDPRLALPMQALMAPILRAASEDGSFHQLMVVGAARRVGTSTIARQVAQELASAFCSVLVVEVDADARAESESEARHVGPVVHARMSVPACLRFFSVGSAGAETLPAAWRQPGGLVVWDVPPPTVAPVSLVMSRRMDGIVLVAQANRTRRDVARHVVQRLEDSGGKMLGVVLNRTVNFIPEWIYRWL